MKPTKKHLLVLTRLPEAGKTKTRLIPALGAQGAADLHDKLAKHTLKRLSAYVDNHQTAKLSFFITGGNLSKAKDWLGEIHLQSQVDGNLGDKITAAIKFAFTEGADQVLVFGTDVPSIDQKIIHSAFEALDRHDTVFGPALDGGYYLMGLNKPNPALFNSIDWGTDQVLQQSLENVIRHNLSYKLLAPLSDVDEAEDLPACFTALEG